MLDHKSDLKKVKVSYDWIEEMIEIENFLDATQLDQNLRYHKNQNIQNIQIFIPVKASFF